MKQPKLSQAQMRTLRAIVTEFDAQSARELERWGQPIRHINAADVGARWATLRVLVEHDLVEVTEATPIYEQRLRRGAYGRRTSGSVTRLSYTSRLIRPTEAGRAAAQENE